MMKRWLYVLYFLLPLVARADASGWQWAIGGSGGPNAYGAKVATDQTGNSYITGVFENTLTIGSFSVTSAGYTDIFVAKFDPAGQPLWLKREGGAGTDKGYGITVDAAANIYVSAVYELNITVGDSSYTTVGQKDIVLMKYNSDGDVIWSKAFGSTATDYATSIKTQDDNLYVTGYYGQTINIGTFQLTDAGSGDAFLLKMDTSGAISWAKSAGGGSVDMALGLFANSIGNVYITGICGSYYFSYGTGVIVGAEVFTLCYSPAGNVVWAQAINSLGSDPLYGTAVTCDASNNTYIAGYSTSAQGLDFGSTTLSGHAAYVAKYGPSGSLLWAKGLSSYPTDVVNSIVCNNEKDLFVAGTLGSWGIFGQDTVFTHGSEDAWIGKLDSNGNHLWSVVGGGGSFDGAYSLALNNNGSIVSTGYLTSNNALFGSYDLGSGQSMFIAALSQTTGIPVTAGKEKQLYIYPNPAYDRLYIRGSKESTEYKIVSITGATLREGTIEKNSSSINIENLSPGIYLLYAAGEVHKIVKE